MSLSLRHSIELYIHAKDTNRPHRMADAFAPDATLVMTVDTPAIAFPPQVDGVEGIAATLSGSFAQRYENVYTFCIGEPPVQNDRFDCDWLVCMTEKATGAARIGFGRYEWRSADGSGRVSALTIRIDEMLSLPADANAPILGWASTLVYPWCSPALLARSPLPDVDAVRQVVDALRERA